MLKATKPIFALLLATAMMCGCSQESDEPAATAGPQAINDAEATVVFRLAPNVSTITRSAEDSYNYVQGTADEYAVNQARIYLFDSPTKLFAKSFLLTKLTRNGTDANGNIIYEAEHVGVTPGTYDIFVTANSSRQIQAQTEDEFLADIDDQTYVRGLITDISGGVLMSNRASDNTGIVIEKKTDKSDNVVSITLERTLARLDIAKGSDHFALTDEASRQYATVTLDGYHIVNLAKRCYTFRHTAVLTAMDEPQWSLNDNFGNVNDVNGYVVDPYFFSKKIDAAQFSNADKYYENYYGDISNPAAITWTAFSSSASTPQYKTAYCLENCMLMPAQKNGYSTGVVFRAKLEPYNNVYRLAADNTTLELVADAKQYPEVLYYYDYKFYTSPAALAVAVGTPSVSADNLDIYQARKYEKTDDGYRCYYNYWIRHQDNLNPATMGVMEFGVVRNNLYRMLITNVSDLGSPLPDVNPNAPDEGETHLKIVLNVKPWIVRDLTNIVL